MKGYLVARPQRDASASGGRRPKSRRMPKAERRIQLLGIAREMIQEGGLDALTMSGLAARSGAVKPVVYEHFENSEAVAIALVDDYFQNISNYVSIIVDKSNDIYEYMDLVVDSLIDYCKNNKFHIRSVTNGFTSSYEGLNRIFREYNRRSIAIFARLLTDQGVSLELAQPAAYGLHELISSMVFEFATKSDVENAKAVLKSMLKGILNALVADAGRKPKTPENLLGSLTGELEAPSS